MRFQVLLFPLCVSFVVAQYNQPHPTTPVPILKQLNRHNEDGSYSYGYEAADGSYKIESKYPTGEVYGKYGFVDDSGKIREVEYGASRRGFEPSGTGINVPPPTLNGNAIAGPNDPEDDGQYREDPSVYYTDPRFTNGERYEPAPKHRNQQPAYNAPQQRYQQPAYNPPQQRYQQPAYNVPQQRYQQPAHNPPQQRYQQPAAPVAYKPAPTRYSAASAYNQPAPAEPQHLSDYQPMYRTQYQPQEYQQAQYQAAQVPISQSRFQGHPADNIDIHSGSYTVNYRR